MSLIVLYCMPFVRFDVIVICRVMRDYMPHVGSLGHDMMFRSTTIQVCQIPSGWQPMGLNLIWPLHVIKV